MASPTPDIRLKHEEEEEDPEPEEEYRDPLPNPDLPSPPRAHGPDPRSPQYSASDFDRIAHLLSDQQPIRRRGRLEYSCRWVGEDGRRIERHMARTGSEFCRLHYHSARRRLEQFVVGAAAGRAGGRRIRTRRVVRGRGTVAKMGRYVVVGGSAAAVGGQAHDFSDEGDESQTGEEEEEREGGGGEDLMRADPEAKVTHAIWRQCVMSVLDLYTDFLQREGRGVGAGARSSHHVLAAQSTFDAFKTAVGRGSVEQIFLNSVCLRVAELNLRKKMEAERAVALF